MLLSRVLYCTCTKIILLNYTVIVNKLHHKKVVGRWSVHTPYQHLPGYLDEFMWRRRHDDHFVAILEDMAAGFKDPWPKKTALANTHEKSHWSLCFIIYRPLTDHFFTVQLVHDYQIIHIEEGLCIISINFHRPCLHETRLCEVNAFHNSKM